MSGESTSGLTFFRVAATGRNRFVSGIAVLAALGGFLFGYDTGIISQALPYLSKDLHPSTVQSSWIVAVLLIGAMVGAATSGYLAEKISRKWTKCISGCVYVVGALAAAFAQDVNWLVAARFVLGLSVGTASFVAPEYISEHTPPRVRGGTVTFNQAMVTLGILLAYVLGYLLRDVSNGWRWMLGIAALPGAALAISMVFVPHSPRWLVNRGRVDEARDVLRRTRPDDADVSAELEQIQEVSTAARGWRLRDLFGADVRPLMVIGIGLAVFQQFVGVNTVIYFASTIIGHVGFSTDQAVLLAVIVGLTNFGFAIGLGPVFWLMISEIYPLAFRSQAMATATVCNWAANFLVSFYFLQESQAIGRGPTFWIYAAIGIVTLVFVRGKVPETKHRSLEEIEHQIGGDRLVRSAGNR